MKAVRWSNLAGRSPGAVAGAGVWEVSLPVAGGHLPSVLHRPPRVRGGVVWLSGAAGGFNGPGCLYPVLARELSAAGIASLRVTYRWPNDLPACLDDALAASDALRSLGAPEIAVVGHSFGGAVAIGAGVHDRNLAAVITLNGQFYGTDAVAGLSPTPLFILHGSADARLPLAGAEDLYARAREPKVLVPLPGGSHGLAESTSAVGGQLRQWFQEIFGLTAPLSPTVVEVETSGVAGLDAWPAGAPAVEFLVGPPHDVPAEALVCWVNDHLKPDRATQEWLYATDPRPFERELYLNRGPHEVGSIVVLQVPELPVPHLLAAVAWEARAPFGYLPPDAVCALTERVLAAAESLMVETLAMPPLGLTGPRLPLDIALRGTLSAIRKQTREDSLPRRVVLALPTPEARLLGRVVAAGMGSV